MAVPPTHLDHLRLKLMTLIHQHHRTRTWFWRTGIAALTAAGLWILIYILAGDNLGVRESMAIIVGAILMWILFLWSFFLMRKLQRITDEVKEIERQIRASMTALKRR